MGCGNSIEVIPSKRIDQYQYDELVGNIVPK